MFIARMRNKHQRKHRAIRCMSTHHEQRRRNDVTGLHFIHLFGWLRTAELGALLWPHSTASRQAADRLARGWIGRRLVLVRDLPDGAGRALVLAAAGVRLLAGEGLFAKPGKHIGQSTDQGWLPPASWKHDLLAAGVLCELHRRGFDIYPETELRRRTDAQAKIPDGLAVGPEGQVLCLEVERARKSGPQMRKLAEAMSIVATGQAGEVAGFKPTQALVAFVPSAMDERGYALSHQARVRAAVQAVARQDLVMNWAACELRGAAGVGRVQFSHEHIRCDRAGAILKRLDAGGWRRQDDGSTAASYSGHMAFVWESDQDSWSYSVETHDGKVIEAGHVATISAAKRAAASALAKL